MAETGSVGDVPQAAQKVVGPFVRRATEVHEVQPLVSYYCYLYAAQLILESQLHLQDESVAEYIEVLLTQVENDRKAIEESAPAIAQLLKEKDKSFKLVLGFSMQILNKAVKEIDSHLCTKRTVQSLMAFKDFVEVTKLWPEFYQTHEEEIAKQVKYAKYHSGRILKALKTGDDPNDFITESDERELEQLLDEPEDGVNEGETELDLPEPPAKLPEEPTIHLPTAPALIKGQKNSLGLPTAPESTQVETSPPALPEKPKVEVSRVDTPIKESVKPVPPSNGTVLSKEQVEEIWKRDEVISKAQKHAKFAISSLNYNDVENAIHELQEALKLLRGD